MAAVPGGSTRLLAAGLALAAAGVAALFLGVTRWPGPAPGSPPARAAAAAPLAALPAPPSGAGAPTRLTLGALGIDAPVTPVRTGEDRALGVPDDVRTLGWWADGAAVGAETGNVVIDGHVDSRSQGLGALARLRDVPVGALVQVATGSGHQDYRVRARRQYAKEALPADIFDRTRAPGLVIVTCGGTFDRASHHYSDNIVVYATPA